MVDVTKEQKVRMLKRMVAIRLFEEKVKQLYQAGEIVGAIHLYIGQEAIAVGHARSGKGATFIECKTYRVEPHCGIIPDGRDKKEVEFWKCEGNDPICRFARLLLREKTLTEEGVNGIR